MFLIGITLFLITSNCILINRNIYRNAKEAYVKSRSRSWNSFTYNLDISNIHIYVLSYNQLIVALCCQYVYFNFIQCILILFFSSAPRATSPRWCCLGGDKRDMSPGGTFPKSGKFSELNFILFNQGNKKLTRNVFFNVCS